MRTADYLSMTFDSDTDWETVGSKSTDTLTHLAKPGSLINNRYRVIEPLGSGASAIVYRCYDLELGSLEVAVKLHKPQRDNDAFQKRIVREVIGSFRIDHPNVVRFFDCFRVGDCVGLSMEYVRGGSLPEIIEEKELSFAHVITILADVCEGLQAIHDRGMVHRDMKPSNIMINHHGAAKIADFGLLRDFQGELDFSGDIDSEAERITNIQVTRHGTLSGTPGYMSPECLNGAPGDKRADIYSLALVAYEVVTGETPFDDCTDFRSLIEKKLFEKDFLCPHELNPACSRELSTAIMKGMSFRPENRYASAAEFKKDILACFTGRERNIPLGRVRRPRKSELLQAVESRYGKGFIVRLLQMYELFFFRRKARRRGSGLVQEEPAVEGRRSTRKKGVFRRLQPFITLTVVLAASIAYVKFSDSLLADHVRFVVRQAFRILGL